MNYRVLVIGVGSIGQRHLRCFDATGRCTLWVCEPNDPLRRRVHREHNVQRSSARLEEFLDDPPDAAVVCTPAHLHIPIATELGSAGVHLLIEKPLSTSTEGIDGLIRLERDQRTKIAIAYVLRTHPTLSAMRDAVLSGRWGDPVQLVFSSGQNFPFFRPAYREIYYASRRTGGGAIQDALPHGINAAQWLIGPMTDVAADAGHQVLDGVAVEDTAHVIARHANVMASYSLNQYQAPNETTLTVVCREGTVRCHLHQGCWLWQVSPESDWIDGGRQVVQRDQLFVAQANGFLDVIEHDRRPLCTLEEGLQTLHANLAILAAADQRCWQRVGDRRDG